MNGKPLRILLIEDNPADALRVHELLEIVADLSLPDSSPRGTLPALHQRAPSIPIVAMTGLNDRSLALESVQQGCQDYLVKGKFDSEMLVRSIHYAIERQRLVRELQTLSIRDSLTGLHNRRSFFAMVEHHKQMSRRSKKGFFIFFADVDDLKKINDTFGHPEGDRALAGISDVLRNTFRDSDIVARIGGDEFAVLALEDKQDAAEILAVRLRKNLQAYQEKKRLKYPLSLSLGSAYYNPESPVTVEALLAEADESMYRQKQSRLKK